HSFTLCFLSLLPPPPRSPLFPYTTLFRSTDGGVGVGGDGTDLGDGLGVGTWFGQVLQLGDDGDSGLVDAALEVHRVHAGSNGLQDRKSTRLNSSHVKISYAVFCLKKKKKQ